jgi:hypothetical protein
MHPVLESLRNTDKQWLIDTLYSFNGGNVEKFQAYKSAWGAQVTSTTGYSTAYNSQLNVLYGNLSLQEIKSENYCSSRCLDPECVIVYTHGHGFVDVL